MTSNRMEGMALLAVVYSPEDIMIERVLQTAGIKVFKKKESIAPVQGIAVGPLAEIKIYVPLDQLKVAQDVLNDAREES